MLLGQAESIRIEDPGVTKAEFVLTSGGQREFHQAKRSHPDGKWSLASMAASDVKVLQAMNTELAGNNAKFVFVSSSDAGDLRELTERARDAESVKEFEGQFLAGKEQKERFDRLRKYWGNASTATSYDVLRRIEIRTSDERSLEEKVSYGARALFLHDPDHVCAELMQIAMESIHQTITRDTLIARLAERGLSLRRLAKFDSASVLVSEVTNRYLANARKQLIRKSIIPRAATRALLSRIDDGEGDSVLTGKAGSGKTACVVELVEALKVRGVPVLVFRLDRLEPVSTTIELGQQLGLEESPVHVLAAAADGLEAVLVVDQLDAVSTTSGRSSDFLDTIENLLAEARGMRDKVKLHVVVICRAFDWENDHRLRGMLFEKHVKVAVAEFSSDEVKDVLAAEGFRLELFQGRQLELLRLPQNLALLLDTDFDRGTPPAFDSAKELFDRYWNAKRRAVATRSAPRPDQWLKIIEVLCDEMTRTQQLFVPREKLDGFDPEYVHQMASEGILSFEGKRYGFGHESFFDYCFARTFMTKDRSLTEFLITDEQHLFRRAQLRQVLVYLRDADRQRYCTELGALLTDARIRTHLKDLALALVANFSDPGEDEWNLLEPWLNSQASAFASGQPNRDKFATLVWRHYFTSQSWFWPADKHGLIVKWLACKDDNLIDNAVNYLRFHQRQFGDKCAELLEPYVGAGSQWKNRLRFVVQWADHENSRRFFELFLRLIDDGTLDDAPGPIAVNSTFWSMLYGLSKARPAWVAEVIAHWLKRRLELIRAQKDAAGKTPWGDLFKHDTSGSKEFHEAATKAPEAFVRNVLPVVLEITDAAIDEAHPVPPRRDAVWPILFYRTYESIDSACLNSLVVALRILVNEQSGELRHVIDELRKRDTFIANYLLLNLYISGAGHFADEAATLLCSEPWRFDCGFADSEYWVATQLIRAAASVCSAENRLKLEEVILHFSTNYERSRPGRRWAGRATFVLLSAILPDFRSKVAKARFHELERKFGKPDQPPRGVGIYQIGSPIVKEAATKMTNEQWLRAIAKYQREERPSRWDEPEKGGAAELAGTLREFVRNEPERFALLSLEFPSGTNPVYIDRTIDGLKGSAIHADLKLAVCRKAYTESCVECGTAIADLLGSIEEPLPDDALQMIDWLATEHPDPNKELWDTEAWGGKPYYGGNIHGHGINTTRGRSAEAVGDLISRDKRYLEFFHSTLDRLVSEPSLAVRSCAASTLLAVARHDTMLAIKLFQRLVSNDERLLGTPYVDRFIYYSLRDHFKELRPIIERMMRSVIPALSRAGSRLASLATFHDDSAADLVNEAMSGTAPQRHGVADVAAANIGHAECRAWCETRLVQFFNDTDAEVRKEAATCFRHLEKEPLEAYESLIIDFCESAAYQDDSSSILHMLEGSIHRLPGITCTVCEKFLDRFSSEAADISTSRAADSPTVAKLIFRTYHQHQQDSLARRCLDLIDQMCLEGLRDVKDQLEEYER
jgi:hypothetical protein